MTDELRDKVRQWLLDNGVTHIYSESIDDMSDGMIDLLVIHTLEINTIFTDQMSANFEKEAKRYPA